MIEDKNEVGIANHLFGRWSMECRENGNKHMLALYQSAGCGRFKITEYGIGIFAKKG